MTVERRSKYADPMLNGHSLLPLAGGVAAGTLLVAHENVALAGASAIAGLLCLVVVSWRWPVQTLYACTGGVLLAGMKFRRRSALASLEGTADAQILFELAVYGTVAVAVATAALSLGLQRGRLRPLEWTLLGYSGWAAASVMWSQNPTLSAVRAIQLAVLVAFAVALTRVAAPVRLLRATTWIYGTFVFGAAGLALLFPWATGGTVDYFTGSVRFAWFSDHPITVAMHAGMAALLVLAASSYPRRTPAGFPLRWILVIALVGAFTMVLVMTGSRGPAAALAAACVIMATSRFLQPERALVTALVVLSAVLAAFMFPSPPRALIALLDLESSAVARFALRGAPLEQLSGFSGRLDLWGGAVGLALDRPLLGQGFGASRAALLDLAHWGGHAHNGPLQSVLDLGAVGAGLLWSAVAVQLVRFLKARPTTAEFGQVRLAVVGILTLLVLASVTDPGIAGPPGALPMMGFFALLIPLPTGSKHG